MTPKMNLARVLHTHSCYARTNARDSDLCSLSELWPDLLSVFEEVQALRDRVTDLEDEVERQTETVARLSDELAAQD
jgi:hypothetical protein